MTIIRPGQRVVHVPGLGVRVSRRTVSSGAGNWWEAGGASGAVAGDAIAAILKEHNCDLIAAPFITADGRINAQVQVIAK